MEKAEPPTLNGLVETALFVEDVGRASDFYETVLGLSKVKEQRVAMSCHPSLFPNMTAADLDTSH